MIGSRRPKRKRFYVGIKASDEQKQPDPHFVIETRNDKGEIVTLPRLEHQEISGRVIKLSNGEYMWEGVKQRTIQIVLVDQDEEMKLEFNLDSNMGRNIVNRLLSTTDYGALLYIRLYMGKPNDQGKKYPQVFVGKSPNDQADPDSIEWKYAYKGELDKYVTTFYNPKLQKDERDCSKLNAFLLEEWIKHCKVANSEFKLTSPDETADDDTADTIKVATEPQTSSYSNRDDGPPPGFTPPPPNDDDLPF